MPNIEEINEGGCGAIGTRTTRLRVLGKLLDQDRRFFGCILMLAHDWADWEANKRSYELFARNCSRALQSAAHGARNQWIGYAPIANT